MFLFLINFIIKHKIRHMDQYHLKLNFSQFIIEKQNSYTDDYKLGV